MASRVQDSLSEENTGRCVCPLPRQAEEPRGQTWFWVFFAQRTSPSVSYKAPCSFPPNSSSVLIPTKLQVVNAFEATPGCLDSEEGTEAHGRDAWALTAGLVPRDDLGWSQVSQERSLIGCARRCARLWKHQGALVEAT